MAQETAAKMQKAVAQEPVIQTPRREVTEEEIRLRAYEIYLARGATPGFELEDWLQAERELRSKE
ncbi:MAG TPA: DUF2934 domain-containing protein [Candidatus Acidoferrales bacterium]|nr:DUF2934 domain-containing protein [Candidatus Acidoferrales bacterium]